MIQFQNLTLRRGTKTILEQTSATINPQERVGVIGRNGAGKSSLFALISGSLTEDSGQVYLPPNWNIAQVAQNLPQTDTNATEFVLQGDNKLTALQQQLRIAEQNNDGMAIAELYLALADAGEYDAKARAQRLILGLGFKTNELELPVTSFSGGWQMRLQLARALMAPSDLLLLDEPTNHLDLDALVWLESWLKNYNGTLLIISHDREFLDAITNVTLQLEQQKITRYTGNYSSFIQQYSQQLELQQKTFVKQQEKIAHLQKFIDRFRAKATKAKQAQSRIKAIEKIDRIAPVLQQAEFTFSFSEPNHLPNPMLKIEQLACGYSKDKVIIEQINRLIAPGQRIGLLGANGQGKSTLVKTIVKQLTPLNGTLSYGKGLRIGYFAQQELDILQEQQNPLEHMLDLAKQYTNQTNRPTSEQELRNFLGQFNFSGEMIKQQVGYMSGGEKARLVLCMLVWNQPNLLILDEPTNHLDLLTREALALALNSFEGSLLLVSHDRALLRSVCDEFWLVGNHKVVDFDGDLTDYQNYLLNHSKAQRELIKSSQQQINNHSNNQPTNINQRELRKQQSQKRLQQQASLQPLKKQLTKIEANLAQLEQQKQQLTTQFNQQLTTKQLIQVNQEFKQLEQQLEQAEQQWLELSEQIEQLQR